MNAAQMVTALSEKFRDAVTGSTEFRGEHSLTVKLESLKPLLRYCADELGFDYLIDISSVDHFENEPRFEMVYELYGLGHHQHLRVKALLTEEQEAPTVTDIWLTANWHEREVYDMMGIGSDFAPSLLGLNEFKCKFTKETAEVAPSREIPVRRGFYALLVKARDIVVARRKRAEDEAERKHRAELERAQAEEAKHESEKLAEADAEKKTEESGN